MGDALLYAAATVPIWSKPLAFCLGLGVWAIADMVYVVIWGAR